MPSEFTLIDRCFKRPARHAVLGVGDDAALLAPQAGQELVVSKDLLVEGTHFLPDAAPQDLGWKSLAVNLSDLAAMGATPRWALLGLALPAADEAWAESFARGFFACADAFEVDLVGGDTTRGPRTISVTILGEVPAGEALRRDGARAGDEVWVSGRPGRAARGLSHLLGQHTLSGTEKDDCLAALLRPQPRVALGLALRGLASAAIDVSDGLLADLGHVLHASRVGAELDSLPAGADADYLAGGDDYELAFTAPPGVAGSLRQLATAIGVPLTRIGRVQAGSGLTVRDAAGRDVTPARLGYDHFSA